MDVHTFDGKLLEVRKSLSFYLECAAQISHENKLAAFELLRMFIKPNVNFNTIVEDFRRDGHDANSNHDPTNDLHADDLLYLCWIILEKVPDKYHFTSLLDMQFTDMNSGMCSQGRTHRLFQLVLAFKEFL